MKNAALAESLGFPLSNLKSDGFLKRWSIYRDEETTKFLLIWVSKRIEDLRMLLEKAELSNTSRLQGQIEEVKRLYQFLQQSDITNEVKTVAAYLGVQ